MKQTDRLPELLAPAGSFTHLKTVIKAGADAVYMGGHQFGARAYADNLSGDNLKDALHYAHFHEKKLYLTVNTLVKEQELEEKLYDFLFPYVEEGLDAVIVQDMGVAAFMRKNFPQVELHGSTQMTITDIYGARAAARMGMQRIVPARELSLSELKAIKEDTGLDMEVFVHGALCYCYSGQCLLSSMYGGRSGNRGRCAQPCRLPYKLWDDGKNLLSSEERHFLSPKDLCALPVLPALIEAKMDSLKIEGRMKNVEYAAGVTAVYRKYLDEYARNVQRYAGDSGQKKAKWKINKQDKDHLEELYSRSGFTEGYWYQHNGQDMLSVIHPRNLGRKIGEIQEADRHTIVVCLHKDVEVYPKDILIIPLAHQEEMVLTVPANLKKQGGQIRLNVPSGKGLKEGMPLYRRRNEQLSRMITDTIINQEINYPVSGNLTIKIGEPARLTLSCRGKEIVLYGEKAEKSEKRATTKEEIFRQMNKTGQTPFYLDTFRIDIEEGSFFPMSWTKSLRQEGLGALQRELEKGERKKEEKQETDKICLPFSDENDRVISLNNTGEKMAVVYDEEMLAACLADDFFTKICLPLDFWEKRNLLSVVEEVVTAGKKVYLSLPQIFRQGENSSCQGGKTAGSSDEKELRGEQLKKICSSSLWTGIYCHHPAEAQFLREEIKEPGGSLSILADMDFYQWNALSIHEGQRLFSLEGITLPVELAEKECEALLSACEKNAGLPVQWMVYGRIPVMRSAQCVKKTMGKCNGRQEILWLEDKTGRKLPVVSHCQFGYNSIWLDQPRNLIGEEMGKLKGKIDTFSFHLFLSAPDELERIKKDFADWESRGFTGEEDKRISPNSNKKRKKVPDEHWNYGIE